MFLGASSPNLSHGLFFKWTKLQRLFSRLPIHFFPCIGFELGWFFPLGCLSFFYRMFKLFPRLPSSFYELPKLAFSRMLKLFPRLLKLFRHVLNTLGCLEFILDYLGYFINCMGSLVRWLPMLVHKHLEVFL